MLNPEIRFKDDNSDWKLIKLNKLCTFVVDNRGKTPPIVGNGIPLIEIASVGNFNVNYNNITKYITKDVFNNYLRKYLQTGDILFSTVGTTAKCSYYNNQILSAVAQNIIGLRFDGTDSKYMYYILVKPINNNYLKSIQMNGVQSSIKVPELMSLSLPITMDENIQQKVSKLLFNIDKKINNEELLIKKLKDTKSSLLFKMFPEENTYAAKLRFKGFNEDWEQRKLFNYANFLSGNGLSWNDISDNGKCECILYGNLYTEYGMISDKIVYKTNKNVKNPVYSIYGDVLIPASDTTPTGLARATCIEKSGVLLGGDINIIRPKDNINGSFLSLAINKNKSELIKLIKGTTVRHIHNSEIKDITVPFTSNINEQEKIVSVFKSLENLITLHESLRTT